MAKIDIGPPDYKKNLPPIIKNNYGRWKYHDYLKPGVLRHVAYSGDVLYSVRAGSPRLVSIDFIRDVCDLADQYCNGYLRFTSRNNIEFLTDDESQVEPLIAACENKGLPVGGTGLR
jgi:sulfite reductase beta subunit